MKNHYKLLNKLFLLGAILLFSAGQVSALGLTTENYSATITDATGACVNVPFTITQPPAPHAIYVNASATGANNGTSWADAYTDLPTAKTEGFRYDPSTGLHTFTDLNMTGTVTRNSSSRDVDKVVISSGIYDWGDAFGDFVFAPALSAHVVSLTNIACYGSATGTATVSASGGVAPYSYSWAPIGGTAATATGLTAGSYTCTVTDADAISTSVQVTINQPPKLTTTTSQTNVSTYGGSDGTATIIATGGTPSYTYVWSPSGGTGATASGLTAGSYNCTVMDENGCQIQSANILITQPAAPPVIAPDANGIIYVTEAGAGNNSGDSWGNATNDLQTAINATGVQQVWVAAGTYQPASGQSFSMKEGVKIYGGFAGTETALSQRNWTTNVTVLKGNGNSVIRNDNNGLTNAAVLDGFTITNGMATQGGGMYNNTASPSLSHIIFSGNTAKGGDASGDSFSSTLAGSGTGGGIYNTGSSPELTDVTINGNKAQGGNGSDLYPDGGSGEGGGIYNTANSSPILTNVNFIGNTAQGGSSGNVGNGGSGTGGGIYNTGSSPVLTNVTLSGNTAQGGNAAASGGNGGSGTGGGIYNTGNSSPTLTNVTLSGNTAQGGSGNTISGGSNGSASGGGIYNDNTSTKLYNSIVLGNSPNGNAGSALDAASANNLIQVGNQGSGGNAAGSGTAIVNTVPNTVFTDFANKDYSLKLNLATVNAGSNTFYNLAKYGDKDLAGNPRIQKGTIDMGAYESPYNAPTPDANGIIYVTETGSGDSTGSSWANATDNLQMAINATGVRQVWVAGGIYQPASGQFFTMKEGVKIYGGFSGTETDLSQRDLSANHTSILKGNNNSVIRNNNNGLTNAAVLDGFTITNGMATQGGGMYNNTASPSLSHIIFSGNTAKGGDAYYNPYPLSTIPAGSGSGGGIYNAASSPALTDVTIIGNRAQGGNGTNMSSSGSGEGGGIYNTGSSSPVLTNVTLGGNTAESGTSSGSGTGSATGGGIYNAGTALTLTNSIIWGNGSISLGVGGIASNNGIYNNGSLTITYSDVQDSVYAGAGNIRTNPLFVDSANGDYHLQAGSPAINKGNNAAIPSGITTDIAGNPRIQKGTVDMGAYESPYGLALTPDANGIIYVTPTGAGDNTGSNWANAANDLQKSMDATGVQQVWVAGGTYTPIYPADSLNTLDSTNRDNAFVLKKDVKIYGGFAGTETALTQRDLSQTANASILSGDIGMVNDSTDNSYHVVISAGDVDSAELNGFTITGGNANDTVRTETVKTKLISSAMGGGMLIVYSSPVLKNLIIKGNIVNGGYYNGTGGYGGGIGIIDTASPVLEDVTITGNVAADAILSAAAGGGIYIDTSSTPTFTNLTVSDNKADYGGGIFSESSSTQLINTTFSGNTASQGGGGVCVQGPVGTTTITNSFFYNNTAFDGNATGSGGGFQIDDNSNSVKVNLTDCVFANNSALGTQDDGGGAITLYAGTANCSGVTFYNNTTASTLKPDANTISTMSGSTLNMNNSIIWGNATQQIHNLGTASMTYNDIQGGYAGTGNISKYPQFKDTTHNNFSLKIVSPAINAGSNQLYPVTGGELKSDSDIAGNPRVYDYSSGGIIDMGAYEFQGNPIDYSNIGFADSTLPYNGADQQYKAAHIPDSITSVTYTVRDSDNQIVTEAMELGKYTIEAAFKIADGTVGLDTTVTLIIKKGTITGITLDNATITYDGNSHALAISGALPAGTSVSYSSPKTEAGTYTDTAYFAGGNNYDNDTLTARLTIEKAGTTGFTGVTFNNATITFDGNTHGLTISGTLPAGASVSYSSPTTEAGIYTDTAYITGGNNYNNDTLTAQLTIGKATITGITLSDSTVTYDGSSHTLVISGTLPAGTSVSYSNPATDAGIYIDMAYLTGGNNYENDTLTANLTIGKAIITGITLSNSTVTYDGNSHALTISGTLPAGASVSYSSPKTDAGIYTDTAYITGGNNYNNDTLTARLTIEKASATGFTGVMFNNSTITFDGNTHGLAISGTLPAGTSVSYSSPKTEAGIYTDTAYITGGNNYNNDTLTAQLTIGKAIITGITLNGSTVTYDGSNHTLVISGTLPAGTSVSYSNPATDAGIYIDMAYLTGGNNYKNDTLTANLTIGKAAITGIALGNATITYDGNSHALAISGTLPAGVSVSYSSPKTDAGIYTDTAYLDGGSNYENDTLTAKLTIIEKAIITGITLDNATVTYDGNSHSLTISGTLPAGVSVSYSSPVTDAGIYTDTAYLTGRNNYKNDTLTAKLTVGKATIADAIFKEVTATYDGSSHSVAVDENTLPKGVIINGYDNNDQTNAGTYTVTAHLSGGNNYNDKDMTATLTINKAAQTITFNAIPVKSLENEADFQLQATASSGLPVTYGYAYTASAPPATVTPGGFVKLLTSGLITITASQAGDNNYLPATEVVQTLQINSSNASIFDIQVGDTTASNPPDSIYYQMDCHNSTESVSITITAEANAIVTPGRTFVIQTPKPGIYTQQVTVTSQDGSTTKDYTITVNKAFSFKDIVVQKFNNVLLVNNNPATNGGYQFVGYKWYKNGVLVGTGPYYSAGNEINNQLDNTAVYSVELTTASGEVLHTCGGVITLTTLFDATLSPNPASPGGTITLTVTLPPAELAQMRISVYSLTGNLIKTVRSSDKITNISLPPAMIPGTYMVKCETPNFQKSFKLIVQ
jgi:hypothetical protein